MTSIRSSVRPSSSKQPWGTIIHPEFGMGHQRMTEYEVNQVVERLHHTPARPENAPISRQEPKLPAEQLNKMVERLSRADCVPDSDRRGTKDSDMGLLNSFAWKGYN